MNCEIGDILEVTIDRFSKSGNGVTISKDGSDRLNVGRIDGIQGDSVKVQYVGNGIGYCLNPERRGEDYNVSKTDGLIHDTTYRTPMDGDQKRNLNGLL